MSMLVTGYFTRGIGLSAVLPQRTWPAYGKAQTSDPLCGDIISISVRQTNGHIYLVHQLNNNAVA